MQRVKNMVEKDLLLKMKGMIDAGADAASVENSKDLMEFLKQMATENEDVQEAMEDMDIVVQTVIKDKGVKHWIKVKGGVFSYGEGEAESPTFTMTADLKIIAGMLMGEVDSTSAYMAGDIAVDGHLQSAMAFQEINDLVMEAFEDMVDDI